MAAQYYLWALGFYGISALGCMLAWYRMTRGIPFRSLQIFLRGSGWIVLCTPWLVSGESGSLSPAFFTMLFDGLTYGPDEMMRAGFVLAALFGLLVLLIILDLILNRSGVKNKENVQESAAI